MDTMTDKEKKVVEELKRRTINDVTPKLVEDVSLFYRFAKARDFNLKEAENMLIKHILQAKKIEIDSLLTDYKPPEVLLKYAPTTLLCFDKEGSIVRLQDCGRADAKGLFTVIKKTDFIKFLAYIIEQDKEIIIKQGGNLGKPMYMAIDDFEHFTLATAMDIKFLQYLFFLVNAFLDNYPETLKSVTVINAPTYFTWIYSAIKTILPSNVSEKVRIYGAAGWKEALLKEIDANDLPAYLGGNKTDPDGNPYCKTFVKFGLPIPKSYYKEKRTKKLSLESDVEKLTVAPFSKEEICFEVKENNSYLEWEFQTKNRDLDFSVYFKMDSSENLKHMVLFHKQRVDTSDEPEKGYFKCENLGSYFIVFDNSYSWIYSKEVYYRASVKQLSNDDVYKMV